jgi:hypothetical protein
MRRDRALSSRTVCKGKAIHQSSRGADQDAEDRYIAAEGLKGHTDIPMRRYSNHRLSSY